MAASLVELEIEYQRLLAEAALLADAAEAGDPTALAKVKQINAQIRSVILQIEQLRGVTSSGDVVRDDQKALGQNANTQDPSSGVLVLSNGRIQLPPETTSGSNALNIPPAQDFGVDNTLRPGAVTQSTPPGANQISTGPVSEDRYVNNGRNGVLTPGGQAGAFAASDDRNGNGGTTNPVVAEVNAIDYGAKIVPQPNVLDQYASYTYQASLYLMTPEQYKTMINTKRRDISGAQLLVQSGGASAGIGRNDYFSLDYYIDNIQLDSKIVGQGSMAAHNVVDVKMTIVEPNGISFIKNLDTAVAKFLGGVEQKKKNYTSQIYLLVIRFYGYDQQGNLVRGGKSSQTSDPNAFVEKWYPLVFARVKFKVASKAVEYEIEAKPPPYYFNASSGRGSIPYNVELSGQTLKDILAGPTTYAGGQVAVTAGGNGPATQASVRAIDNAILNPSPGRVNVRRENGYLGQLFSGLNRQTPLEQIETRAAAAAVANAPPKADAANSNKKTVRAGLMAAMNEYQQDLVKQNIIEVADNYEVEFALESLASAKVTNPGLKLSATSMATPGTAGDQKLGSKQSMDPNSRAMGATAGLQIVQFIDNLVRNSSYIKSQQLIEIKEDSGKETVTGVNIQNTSWYKIGLEATAIGWDNKRNDYAYNMKFIVSPYKISQLNTPYFKPPLYNGSHKQYTYWFSGQNDAVLSYEEQLNALYQQTLSGTNLNNTTSSAIDLLKFQYQTRSGQSDQNAEGRVNEPAANAADQLYNPTNLGKCHLTIVGDPAWLQQGESWAGFYKTDTTRFRPFLADGTINFDAQDILFEIGYNVPADYDMNTGLIAPNNTQLNFLTQQDQQLRRQGSTQINRIYIATEVKSNFSKGKFTQDLTGSLMIYYPATTKVEEQKRTAAQQAAPVTASPAPPWQPTKIQQPVPSAIPANPGTLGSALNALDVSYEGATILAAANEAPAPASGGLLGLFFPKLNQPSNATNAAPQKIVKDR